MKAHAKTSDRSQFDALLDKINAAEEARDLISAVTHCLSALALAPEHIGLRCHAGFLLREKGRLAEAEKILREGLEQQPESISLSRGLTETLAAQGKFLEAVRTGQDLLWPLREDATFRVAYASWLARASETDTASCKELWNELNAIEKAIEVEQAAEMHNILPPNTLWVQGLYDRLAERFDEHLGELGYNGPQVLRALVEKVIPGRKTLNIVDLGCGTGQAGVAFKPLAKYLTGIDISGRMIARAHRRNIYDRLIVGDMMQEMKDLRHPADLIIAADVLIYTGALEALFKEIATTLWPGGTFAATIEKTDEDDWLLCNSRRYAHSEAYVRKVTAQANLHMLAMEPFPLRREGTSMIDGLAFVLEKKK